MWPSLHCAQVPHAMCQATPTTSPTATSVQSGPTSTTVPTHSWPSGNGPNPENGVLSSMTWWSRSHVVAASGRYELAGWWSRVGAQLIDGLIIGIGGLVILVILGSVASIGFFDDDETGVGALIVGLMLWTIAITIVALLYAPLMMSRTNGKTLGRMAVGIRVMRADGGPMTFGFAMLREVAVKALLFGILGSITAGIANLLDCLWPLWDDENRALHDFVVNTRVVKD